MQIQIIDVSSQHVPVPGKAGYTKLDVAYKKDGKVEGKPIMSFTYPEVFKILQACKKDDWVEITDEKKPAKDGKEYWQWTNAKVITAPTNSPAASATTEPNKKFVSTYETPEERKEKQRLIVRQSCLSNALIFHSEQIKNVEGEDVIPLVLATAERFVEFVYSRDSVQEIVDMPNDIPV